MKGEWHQPGMNDAQDAGNFTLNSLPASRIKSASSAI